MPETIREYEHLLLERDGRIARLWLNRPERMNSLYTPVFEEFVDALELLRDDQSARVVVISGKGRAFCAGGDIKLDVAEVGNWDASRMIYENEIAQRMILGIRELPKPVIARLNGVAVGGGCDLALACDIVIGSTHASLGEFWIRRGLTPGMGGAWMLPRLVGTHRAKQILFSGELVPAERAAAIGMINAAVAPDELDAEVDALAAQLANMPTVTIRAVKKLVDSAFDMTLADHFHLTTYSAHFVSQTEDYAEGVAAFQEKREPDFKGR
jgi:2-(1,2-epoxy-1,2-dihydrophenyl)acetyl-CoA isomerase